MQYYKFLSFCVLALVGLTGIGCSSPLTTVLRSDGSGPDSTGSLVLTIGNNSRTLAPLLSMIPASYTITGTGPRNTAFTQSSTATSFTQGSLAMGHWTIVVQALNLSSVVIGSGTAGAQVNAGSTTIVPITVLPIEGLGTLALTAIWTADLVPTPSLAATLVSATGDVLDLPFLIRGSQATYSNTQLPNGYSNLSVSLMDQGVSVMGAVEIVRIIAGQTTSGTFTFTNSNQPGGPIQVTVTQNLQNPLTVVLSGAASPLVQGNTATLTAAVSNFTGAVVYSWYVNGLYAASGPTFSFGGTQEPGSFRIDVAGFTNDATQAGSATATIQMLGLKGLVTSLVLPGLNSPSGLATDGMILYAADTANHRIRKLILATGAVSTLAGSTTSGNADGLGTAARFNHPSGLQLDSTGTILYVADTNNCRIRAIVLATGAVSTLAGNYYGSSNGIGTAAQFGNPTGLATDGPHLYIADTGNNRIRKLVLSTGAVTTLVASGLQGPSGLAVGGANLYVADRYNNRIRTVALGSGAMVTLAGAGYGSANGVGTAATFGGPAGLATDGTFVYVADTGNNLIRKIRIATGVVTTVTQTSVPNPVGFLAPIQLATVFDALGSPRLFVADTGNNLIRIVE